MAAPQDLGERLLEFAARIVRFVQSLPPSLAGKRIGDQLLRSGTSVGANYEEAQGAESHNDFVPKLQIALKEIREANYWLRVLERAGVITGNGLKELLNESTQLRAMLSNAVATAKGTSKTK
jgi:four helix bundle protein